MKKSVGGGEHSMPKKPAAGRPEKVKFVVRAAQELGGMSLNFGELTSGKKSVYVTALEDALAKDGAVEIAADDKYVLYQLRQAAQKMEVRLTFGQSQNAIFVKPLRSSEAERRLLLYLREPRAQAELESIKVTQRLELNLTDTLARLAKAGLVKFAKDKWVAVAAAAPGKRSA